MNITIQDKDDFITNFVNPIAAVAERVQLRIEGNKIHAIAISQDNTTIICTSYDIQADMQEKMVVNVGDVRLFSRTLDAIETNAPVLQLTKNALVYRSKKQAVKIHFLEDGIIAALPYKKEKLMFDGVRITISNDSLKRILKGASIAVHSTKAYLTHEDSMLFCEFTDKIHENVDSYKEMVVDSYSGPIFEPIVIKVDSLRIASKLTSANITLRVDTARGLIAFDDKSSKYETSLIFMPLNK